MVPTQSMERLVSTLRRIDGKGYKAYKDLRGSYQAEGFLLHVEHVQGDPFADPSRVRVEVPGSSSQLPEWALATRERRVSAADHLNRELADALRQFSRPSGTGKSGRLFILQPGQEVLERSSMAVHPDGRVEACFQVGLPAAGRRVLGRKAIQLFEEDVTDAVMDSLFGDAIDEGELRRHLEVVESAQSLRSQLEEAGLVAFVADASILPRESGTSDRPMRDGAVAFRAPEELAVTLEDPHEGPVRGLGVPRGVFLVVGGGFHGKSTLLRAIERGVYDHVPLDGRERVVTVPDAVKVRAEDGRAVTGVDIANFIDELPGGQGTRAFTTRNASGSTSQAAGLVEALEAGASCLLMDEDTSATNLLIRDARMQALIAEEHEPITPYIDRARRLADEEGVSTILVCGGSGDYFDVADHVLAMEAYAPRCVTPRAREVADELPSRRTSTSRGWRPPRPRVPVPGSVDPGRGRKPRVVKTPTIDRLVLGTEEVALGGIEQLVEVAQGRAVAHALAWSLGRAMDGERAMPAFLDAVMETLEREGLNAFTPFRTGNLTRFRRFELAALLNRLRGLEVSPGQASGS